MSIIKMIPEIFEIYAAYSGESILLALYFVSMVYMALNTVNRSTRTVLLYGSTVFTCLVFFPVVYFLYTNYVDKDTYWRLFWILPVTICLAFSGTKLINEHRMTGLLLAVFILILGGRLVYLGKSEFKFADNPYQIPSEVIEVADYLETQDIQNVKVAVPFEMLDKIRVYDINIKMPYGREQYEQGWGETSGFYQLMIADVLDYEALASKCEYNTTGFIVVNSMKPVANKPEDYGFELCHTVQNYNIYEYMPVTHR